MTETVTIDKSGRLVLPKAVRDAIRDNRQARSREYQATSE